MDSFRRDQIQGPVVLQTGEKLGCYDIARELGRGGMGVVYLGRDTRLDRDVAIKALPEHLAQDPDRLARFEREAKTLAQLNHPNVAGIYGVEEHDGARYLVLEYVEGETLADRLDRGAMPVDEALEIADQIAAGVEAAHEAGVIHRDLKPGNVIVTPAGQAKVLDFGLARAEETSSTSATSMSPDSPTITTPPVLHSPTMPGVILGTAAYMSPEQARGRSVDKRTDIWSFGVILYEMLTGVSPFVGETVSDSIGAVLHKEIEVGRLPPGTPAAVPRVLRRCLARDKRHRYRDIGDAALDLKESADGTVAAASPSGSRSLAMAAVAFALGAVLVAVAFLSRPSPPAKPLDRPKSFGLYGIDMPLDAFTSIAISPSGDRIVLRGRGESGATGLVVRELDSLEYRSVPGSESGYVPFFRPDGREFCFFAFGELLVAPAAGGAARIVNVVPGGFTGGTWFEDGSIVYTGGQPNEMYRLSSPEAKVEKLTIRSDDDNTLYALPWRIPGRNAIVCSVIRGERFDIGLVTLDEPALRVIAHNGHQPVYCTTGHLVYHQANDGALMAVAFDADSLTVTGNPFSTNKIPDARMSYQGQLFAVADDGTLAVIPPVKSRHQNELVWVDREGREESIIQIDRSADLPRLSHAGDQAAFRTPAPMCDIWIYSFERGTTSRLTQEGDNHGIVWSRDDDHIFTVRRYYVQGQAIKLRADGVGDAAPVSADGLHVGWAAELVGDEEALLVVSQAEGKGWDIGRVDAGDGSVTPLLAGPFGEYGARLSPDGRFLAYVSEESGHPEVYIRPYPSLDAKTQVSAGGGRQPVWARDGSELFYRNGAALYAVSVDASEGISVGRPEKLFQGSYAGEVGGLAGFDVSPDGTRFLMIRLDDRDGTRVNVEVIVDWFSVLKSRETLDGADRG